MGRRWRAWIVVPVVLAAVPALALSPGTDVFIPAAARGAGATGTWVTDVFIYNPGTAQASVNLYWLQREVDSSGATPRSYTVAPGATLALESVIQSVFGLDAGAGAIRITSDQEVVVSCRIYNTGSGSVAAKGTAGSGTFGQGFEGIPASAAISAGGSTDIVGLASNGSFTTNLFAVNTADQTTQLTFELRGLDGTVLATRTYQLPPMAAFYRPISDLGGPQFDRGTVHVTVDQGSAIVVGSTIDAASGDPTTMEAWWPLGTGGATLGVAGSYYGWVRDRDGSLGGMQIDVNDSGEVVALDFMFPSADDQCSFLFGGGGSFDTPVPLTDFEGGVSFENSYQGGGTMTWTLTLTVETPGLYITGTMDANGSGWTGSNLGCNGAFPQDDVRAGKGGSS